MKAMKILVVDDDPIVLESCKRVLAEEDFDVTLVSNADDALDVAAKQDFDLLVVDVKMPKRDGMYLMKEIKKQWSEIPMIVMSGYPTPETIAEGIKMGAAKFISKPFTPDELLESVHEVLNLKSR
jgi:DNA-binding NtrC family response regulator